MTDYTPTQQRAIDLFASALQRSDKANGKLAGLQAEAQEALDELQWYAAHPALAGIDLAKIAAEIRELGDAKKADEPPAANEAADKPAAEKPKRTRRTKEQIAADKAAAAVKGDEKTVAALANETPANEGDAAAQQVEGQGLAAVPEPDEAAPPQDDTFSEAVPASNVAAFAPPAPPAGQAFLNPFAKG